MTEQQLTEQPGETTPLGEWYGPPVPRVSDVKTQHVHGDLDRLPGAGPGLIWMLNECGIETLSDLTQADATALTAQLGVVGQILDLDRLITFAKRQMSLSV